MSALTWELHYANNLLASCYEIADETISLLTCMHVHILHKDSA